MSKTTTHGYVFFNLAGLLTPFTRSEKVPKEQKGNAVVVVGSTFKEIVLDKEKDVLIMSYSRRSDACKTMDKVYKVYITF